MPAGPSEWDRRHYGRHTHIQEYLKVDGLTVKYIGPGENDQQAAAIFADRPVPQDVPLYYFEVTIVNKGDSGFIGIGFCTDTVNLGRLPGWEPHSYGYHGDDGHAFHGGGQGRPYGPGFTTGDVIGVLLDRSRKNISYYKNGEALGVAFYDVQELQLYPCVGMRTRLEEVTANFGGSAFRVDVKKLNAEFKERVFANIAAVQLPATVEVPTAVHDSNPSAAAAAATPAGVPGLNSSRELEAAATACRQAIRALDSSSSAALASLEAATQAYLAALEAAAGDVSSSSGTAGGLAAAGTGIAGQPAAGTAAPAAPIGVLATPAAAATAGTPPRSSSQPLTLYYVFNYLLHRRCWKTAAIIAQEMLAASSSSQPGSSQADAAEAAAAAAGDAPVDMECTNGAGSHEDHQMGDAASDVSGAAAAAAGGGSNTAAAPSAFSEADVQDALLRQKIYDAICAGSIADALAIVRAQYGSSVLDQQPHLHFKLKVQQFVELVRAACSSSASQPPPAGTASNGAAAAIAAAGTAEAAANSTAGTSGSGGVVGFEAALTYGRAELGPASTSAADEELLSDALSLMAYADPGSSPCGHLLRDTYRAELAEELNGALLKARGSSGKPLLECAYRQAVVLVKELKRANVPAALVLDVPNLCSGRTCPTSAVAYYDAAALYEGLL